MTNVAAVIPAGASVSQALMLGGDLLPGHLITLSGLDGGITTLSFDVAKEEADPATALTWVAKYVNGAEVTMTVAASRSHSFYPPDWLATDWLRVRLGTHAAPVTVAGTTTVHLGVG